MLAACLYQMVVNNLQAIHRDRRAVTAVEYAIIALIIALAIVGGVSRMGSEVATPFNQVASEL